MLISASPVLFCQLSRKTTVCRLILNQRGHQFVRKSPQAEIVLHAAQIESFRPTRKGGRPHPITVLIDESGETDIPLLP